MKVTIGEKIKQLRKEMGLTQENVHSNQSQISQIESGRISNPDENTLLLIAKNMEISFDELINDTNWVKPEKVSLGKELAFSPSKFDIEIDDMLNITYSHKSYPLYNENGEKNEFCIYSGQPLIDKCKKCGRTIKKVKQQFCSGCGNILFTPLSIPERITEIISDSRVLSDYFVCEEIIENLSHKYYKEREVFLDLKDWITTEDESIKEQYFNIYSKDPGKPTLLLGHRKYMFDLHKNIAERVQNGKELELEELIEMEFDDQMYEAIIKKLKMSLKDMERPDDEYGEEEDIKLELFRKVASQLNLKLSTALLDPEMTSKEMIEMLNVFSTTDDSDKIIETLQSKIDLDSESGDNSDEEISENGNSETAAENETEQANDNAKDKDNKESNND